MSLPSPGQPIDLIARAANTVRPLLDPAYPIGERLRTLWAAVVAARDLGATDVVEETFCGLPAKAVCTVILALVRRRTYGTLFVGPCLTRTLFNRPTAMPTFEEEFNQKFQSAQQRASSDSHQQSGNRRDRSTNRAEKLAPS